MKKKLSSNSSKFELNVSALSYATQVHSGGTSRKENIKKKVLEKHIKYGNTTNNSPREDKNLDGISVARKNSQINYNYQNNLNFESIFHGGKLPANVKLTSIQLEKARQCCETCKIMALGLQVLQKKEQKNIVKATPSSISQSEIQPPQNEYFKDICTKQRMIYISLFDIINRIVYDADQKRKKFISCEQFFVKLEANLELIGAISKDKILDQIDVLENQLNQDYQSGSLEERQDDKMMDYENLINSLTSENEELKDKVKELEESSLQINLNQNALNRDLPEDPLVQEHMALQESFKELESTCQELVISNQEYQSQLQDLINQNKLLEIELKNQERSSKNKILDFEDKIKELLQKIQDMKKSSSDTSSTVEKSDKEKKMKEYIKAKDEKIKELQHQIDELKYSETAPPAKDDQNEKYVEKLKNDVNSLNDENFKIEKKFQDALKEYRELQERYEKLQNENRELPEKFEKLQNENKELRQKLAQDISIISKGLSAQDSGISPRATNPKTNKSGVIVDSAKMKSNYAQLKFKTQEMDLNITKGLFRETIPKNAGPPMCTNEIQSLKQIVEEMDQQMIYDESDLWQIIRIQAKQIEENIE